LQVLILIYSKLLEIDYFANTMYEILFLINITRILENIALDLVRIFKYILNLISNNNAVKSFNILAINLNVLHNYFDVSNKIILDLYLTKFLLQQNYSIRVANASRLEVL